LPTDCLHGDWRHRRLWRRLGALVLRFARLPSLLLSGWLSSVMMTAATAMSPAMSAFDTGLVLTTLINLRTLTGLRGRLSITGMVLGARQVFGAGVIFDWDPVALTPCTIGGWIALRADKDPSPVGRSCLAIIEGIAFRYGFRRRLPLGTVLAAVARAERRIRNAFYLQIFVGRLALINSGQCSSLYYLRTTAEKRFGENNTRINSSRRSRPIPRGAPGESCLLPPSPVDQLPLSLGCMAKP